MEKYNKPQIVSVDDMAEGVYAASGAGATSGTGTNISWSFLSDGMHDTSSHAATDPHPIRKYSIVIPATYYDQWLHFTLDINGPGTIRHAGFHHQKEETVRRSGNHVEGDFKVSAENNKYIYVCVENGESLDDYSISNATVTLK